MSHRRALKREFVLQRTTRALLCLFGIVWVLFLQTAPGDGSPTAPKLDGSDFVLGVYAEVVVADEFGTLEDSVELARGDLHEHSTGNSPASPALTGASSSARRARPDLSPPLLV